MSIQAMKQALEALGYGYDAARCTAAVETIRNAESALRAAIEAAEKQEPVAIAGGEYPCNVIWYAPVMAGTKLYTRPQPAIPEWQPIETAPKEWGSYLIWHPKYGMETLWFQLKDGGSDGRKAGNWYAEEGEDDYPRNYQVTHWMPLPAAPKPENSHD